MEIHLHYKHHLCVGVPEPVVFRGEQMNELNMFAELKLSFLLVLTNVLSVQVALHQVHGDKTSSASVEFDMGFLVRMYVGAAIKLGGGGGRREGGRAYNEHTLPLLQDTQGVSCSQDMHQIDGQDESMCVKASLQVRSLQKLKSPLKLLMKVCLWESGQERCANISYTFKELPNIATICS